MSHNVRANTLERILTLVVAILIVDVWKTMELNILALGLFMKGYRFMGIIDWDEKKNFRKHVFEMLSLIDNKYDHIKRFKMVK